MELNNEFHVHIPVERAWALLTDLERIAPCMPGAALEEIEGDEHRGNIKIKVGPITAQYKGKATFLERDVANHKAVLRAEGRDTKGQGNASATITANMHAADGGTRVSINTDLTITGKVAQFGRGVLADVSSKILGQFVQCLEHSLLATPESDAASVAAAGASPAAAESASSGASAAASPSGEPTKPSVRKIEYKEAAPVDLLETAGTPVIKRAAPVVAVVFLLVWLLRRRRK